MLAWRHRDNSQEWLIKKQIFSLFFLCDVSIKKYTGMGIPLPAQKCGYHLTQAGRALIAASHLSDNKDNDGDDKSNQDKGSVKSRAEDVANQFTTG